MTTRDAILARLGRSPATMAELYDSILRLTDTHKDRAYEIAFSVTRDLIASGDVEHYEPLNLYRLTTKQIPNNQPKE